MGNKSAAIHEMGMISVLWKCGLGRKVGLHVKLNSSRGEDFP